MTKARCERSGILSRGAGKTQLTSSPLSFPDSTRVHTVANTESLETGVLSDKAICKPHYTRGELSLSKILGRVTQCTGIFWPQLTILISPRRVC
jgi:hypothetical protein